jgi:CDP-glucose 4,6-dehydratase
MDLKSCYEGKRILVTGHTGFKGVWLCVMLNQLGAEVHGLALPPITTPNLFADVRLDALIKSSTFLDIRDSVALERYLKNKQFDLIFHLAAQAIVSEGYKDPKGTFETNVMGMVNLLLQAPDIIGLKGIVCSTTDKVYSNDGSSREFKESDRLGGSDPYSGSKAATENVMESLYYLLKEKNISLISCRAGNVIGGGDWAKNRLVPDAIRAFISDSTLEVRHPNSTRPWQHVLDCLCGYLLVGKRILESDVSEINAFNFGPKNSTSVEKLLTILKDIIGIQYVVEELSTVGKEAESLTLDSNKAKMLLMWETTFSSENAISETASWYRSYVNGENPSVLIHSSIERFLEDEVV